MLTINQSHLLPLIASYWWPFLRIDAIVLAAPLFTQNRVPVRVRLLFALVLTFLITPLLKPPPEVELFSLAAVYFSVNEIIIGLSFGFLLQLLFEAVVIAGQAVANAMGLGFAMMMDQQRGVSIPVVSQYFLLLTTLLFLSLNGHLLMISALVESFDYLPVAVWHLDHVTFWHLVGWGSQMFVGALKIALPAIVALLIVQVSFGVMSKAAPTLNMFAMGFPIIILAGFIILQLMLPSLLPVLQQMMDEQFNFFSELFRQ